jgi:hypothetical protein
LLYSVENSLLPVAAAPISSFDFCMSTGDHIERHEVTYYYDAVSTVCFQREDGWPAAGSEDTELGVLMEPEVGHGETEVHAGVQA